MGFACIMLEHIAKKAYNVGQLVNFVGVVDLFASCLRPDNFGVIVIELQL